MITSSFQTLSKGKLIITIRTIQRTATAEPQSTRSKEVIEIPTTCEKENEGRKAARPRSRGGRIGTQKKH